MTRAKKKKARAAGATGNGRTGIKVGTPLDLGTVREQISDRVGGAALNMVEGTITEAGKGHYGAMKYLFEMIGLYPSSSEEKSPEEDSLAKTLLKHLGLPEDPALKAEITKDCRAGAAGDDALE
jgi:hypothetical protein